MKEKCNTLIMQIFSRNCFGRTKHRYIDKHLFPSSRNSIMTEMRRPATPPGLLVILPRATLCYIPQLNHTATAQLPHLKTINVINLYFLSFISLNECNVSLDLPAEERSHISCQRSLVMSFRTKMHRRRGQNLYNSPSHQQKNSLASGPLHYFS